jgi:hypothetical protein
MSLRARPVLRELFAVDPGEREVPRAIGLRS